MGLAQLVAHLTRCMSAGNGSTSETRSAKPQCPFTTLIWLQPELRTSQYALRVCPQQLEGAGRARRAAALAVAVDAAAALLLLTLFACERGDEWERSKHCSGGRQAGTGQPGA